MAIKGYDSGIETIQLYNNTVTLAFSPGNHRYSVTHNGQKIYGTVGVTTVVGVLDKPYLLQWAVNQAVETVRERLASPTPIDEVETENLLKNASFAWRQKRDKAGDIGTITHKWIEDYIRSKIEGKNYTPLLPENPVIKKAAQQFMAWEQENVTRFVSTEQKVYSLKYNYAGTCDFIYIDQDNNFCLGDLKTSKHIYDTFPMQLAGYQYALEEESMTWKHAKPLKFHKSTIVKIDKEEGKLVAKSYFNYKDHAVAFLSALKIYRYLRLKGGEKM
jgi:hypothetical protein